METLNPKPSSDQLTTQKPPEEPSNLLREKQILYMFTVTAEAMGVELPSPPVIQVYFSDLANLSLEEIARRLSICRRTKKSYGKFPAIEMILGVDEEDADAEARVAFETAIQIAKKHGVPNQQSGEIYLEDCTGPVKRFVSEDGEEIFRAHRIPVPQIEPQISYAVRLSGGWSRLYRLTDEDFGYYQKVFFEHFKGYDAAKDAASRRPQLVGFNKAVEQLGAGKVMP